jgi:type II secretory pathway component GspD/PulD (secretin)
MPARSNRSRPTHGPAALCFLALIAGQPVGVHAALTHAAAVLTDEPTVDPNQNPAPAQTPPPAPPLAPPIGTEPAPRPPTPVQPETLAPTTTINGGAPTPGVPVQPGVEIPGTAPAPARPAPPPLPVPEIPGQFTFNFPGEVELTDLVDFVKDSLGLQVFYADGGLKGQKIILPTPITLPEDRVLEFLVSLLEQKDFTLVQQPTGVYAVVPRAQVQPGLADGPLSPTRIIPTPGIKPSSLQQAIQAILGVSGAGTAPVFLDELGVIVVTGSSRTTANIENLVTRIVKEQEKIEYQKFPLTHIAAAAAKERVLELLGVSSRGGMATIPGQPPGIPGGFSGPTLSSLADRLTLDATSNALFFRGRADEGAQLQRLLAIVDAPNSLVARWYPVGLATSEAVAAEGKRQQLGESVVFESAEDQQGGGGTRVINQPVQTNVIPGMAQGGGAGGQDLVGSGFVLYPASGGFMYRGTEVQHAKIVELIAALGDLSERDQIDVGFFKLRHGKAEDIADIINNLINNTTSTGNSGGLLGGDLGGGSRSRIRDRASSDRQRRDQRDQAQTRRTQQQQGQQNAGLGQAGQGGTGEPGLGELSAENIHIVADVPNNQVIVKAPKRVMPQFAKLIDRIDLRRPQVYIEAKIVAITSGDDFRLAVEAQQIIGQFAFNTNFGLGSLTQTTTGSGIDGGSTGTTTGGFTSRKNVAPNLPGMTSALIRSRDVPFVVTALARNTDARIVATPQLLVDDNEEAEVASLDQQPTTSSNTGTATTTVSFQGFEDAGPKLTVKPQIAEGGYLRLEYNIELSSFQGSGSNGIPPPKLKNNISADSVTVPGDMTIVVGGLTQENLGRTVVKVPLLGDIPIIGNLFKDQNSTNRKTTLFIFITPRIMRDPSFADMRLLTRNPARLAGLDDPIPAPEFERIDVLDTAKFDTAQREEDRIAVQAKDFPPAVEPEKPKRRKKPVY